VTRPKFWSIQLPILTIYCERYFSFSASVDISRKNVYYSWTLWQLKVRLLRCVETSVPCYPLMLRHILDERKPQLHGCLKSHFVVYPRVRVLNFDWGSTQRLCWQWSLAA
jgi:hypothetical protein